MTSIKLKKIAQILFVERLSPFPNGQSFGLALRAMAPRLVPYNLKPKPGTPLTKQTIVSQQNNYTP